MMSIFERRSSAVTGMLPSHFAFDGRGHRAQNRRNARIPGPRASRASHRRAAHRRAPTASTSRSTKLSMTKKLSSDLMVRVAARQHAALAQLEDEQPAARRIIEARSQRTNAGILVAEGKPRLALIGRDQIEALKSVMLPQRLATWLSATRKQPSGSACTSSGMVRRLKMPWRKSANTTASAGTFLDRPGDLFEYLVGDRTVVERVDLEKPVAPDDDRILVDRRPGRSITACTSTPAFLQVVDDEVPVAVVAEHGRERHPAAGRRKVLCHDRQRRRR